MPAWFSSSDPRFVTTEGLGGSVDGRRGQIRQREVFEGHHRRRRSPSCELLGYVCISCKIYQPVLLRACRNMLDTLGPGRDLEIPHLSSLWVT